MIFIEMVKWLNDNNGFVMALLTFIYVIATILICKFNYKSAKATNEQTSEMQKQFRENSRARIIPKIDTLEGKMTCLVLENIGKDIAMDVEINVDEEWLKILEQTKTFPETACKLRKFKNKKIFMTVNQKMYYGLCVPGNGYDDFKKLGEIDLRICIKYKTLDQVFEEEFIIPLSGYNYMVNQDDYARLTNKQIEQMEGMNENLKNIENAIESLVKN